MKNETMDSVPTPTAIRQTKRCGLHIIIFSAALIVLIATFSYSASDVPLISGGIKNNQFSNLLGRFGAAISYFLILTCGLAAYPVTLLFFTSTVRRLINPNVQKANYLYFTSILFFIIGLSICLGSFPNFMNDATLTLNIHQTPGGAIGSLLAHPQHGWIYNILSQMGCLIISIGLITFSLFTFYNYDWHQRYSLKAKTGDKHPASPTPSIHHQESNEDDDIQVSQVKKMTSAMMSWFKSDDDSEDGAPPQHETESEYVSAIADPSSPVIESAAPRKKPRAAKQKIAEGEQTLPLISEDDSQIEHEVHEEVQLNPIEETPEEERTDDYVPNDDHILEEDVTPDILQNPLGNTTTTTKKFKLPSSNLLTEGDSGIKITHEELQRKKETIQETLENFKIKAHMGESFPGPRVTLFEIIPDKGVRIEKIASISNNLSMELQTRQGIRIITPIPGRRSVGVEVPNDEASNVWLRGMVESKEFKNSKHMIPIVLGKDISGKTTVMDLAKAPHMLIAGATGAGKSVFMNCLIMSLLYRFSPDELELIMVDPKKVEFTPYATVPHLVCPIITEADQVPSALRWAAFEMDVRYDILAAVGVRNLGDFNTRTKKPNEPKEDKNGNAIPDKLPMTVIIIDEVADLMSQKNTRDEVENSVSRIAAKARAVGIHLVLATQSPRTNVITGVIKANFPTRIAFKVSSHIDSRTILDSMGAEKLLGQGDMLFNPPGSSTLERLQSAWTPDEDIEKVVGFIASQRGQRFKDVIKETPEDEDGNQVLSHTMSKGGSTGDAEDSLLIQAMEIIKRDKKTSISYIQRKLRIGYNKAANIIEELEDIAFLSPPDHAGKREILDDIYKDQ